MTLALSPTVLSAFSREIIKIASSPPPSAAAEQVGRFVNYLGTPEGKGALKVVGALGGGVLLGHMGHKMYKDYKRGRQMRMQHEYAFHDGGF